MRLFSQNETLSSLTREQIQDKHKWNLQDIYLSDELWEKDFEWVESNIERYNKFIGKLGESAETMLAFFRFDDEIGIKCITAPMIDGRQSSPELGFFFF